MNTEQDNTILKSKESKFRQKCAERRQKLGLPLLPLSIENKIYRYKKKLKKKNVPEEKIKELIRKTRRKAEKRWKRSLNSCCFRCRQPGHKIDQCPELETNLNNGVGVCYNCGSANHKIYHCKKSSNTMEYATCFICNERGHISRDCTQNSRGVYPKGGCCKKCSSINHLIKDCPEMAKREKEEEEILLSTLDPSLSADADLLPTLNSTKKSKIKVVKF